MPSPPLKRRAVLFGLLAAPLTVAACSQKGGTAAPTTSTPTTSAPPAPTVTGKDLPADLLATLGTVYFGGTVPATGAVATALAARKPLAASLTVVGATGAWQGTLMATVTYGSDCTLLVKTKGWQVVGGWWPSLGVTSVAHKPARVLVVGSDARPNENPVKCRADAIHLIGVDASGVGGLVGIPRDSYVSLSTGGTDKINAALVYGGAKGIVDTVRRTTGLPIDGYLLTGFKGFRAIIDGVGGIPYVSKVMLKSDGGQVLVRVGRNVLNASTGLGLARERHSLPNGDFGRSANQGAIMLAGMAVARARGPLGLPKLLSVISANVTTNLSAASALVLAASVFTTKAAVPNLVAPGSVGTKGGQSVVLLGAPAKATFADLADGRLGG